MTSVAIYQQTGMPARLDSWVRVLTDVAQLAETVATTDFVPAALRGNVPAITATILYGREVGFPPMQALRSIYIVEGRPALAAEAMRGLALAAGHQIEYARADGSECTVRGRRAGQDSWHTVTWTLDIAQRLRLTGKRNWQNYPRAMLKARATSELCRDLFADTISGFAAVEDYDEMPDDVTAVAEPPAPAPRTVSRARARKAVSAPQSAPDAAPEVTELSPPVPSSPAYDDERDGDLEYKERTPSRGARRARQAAQDAAAGDWPPAPPPPPSQDDSGTPSVPVTGTIVASEPPMPPEDPHRLPPSPDYEETPLPIDDGEAASPEQGRAMFALLGQLGKADVPREERMRIGAALLGRPLTTFRELTRADASRMLDTLTILTQSPDGAAQLDAIVSRS